MLGYHKRYPLSGTSFKMAKPITNSKWNSDRIGVYCSTLLLILPLVFLIVASSGLGGDRDTFFAGVTVLLLAPLVLVPASFVCWVVLYWNNCRLRYHLSWIAVLAACFAGAVILGAQ